ncbi:OmpA family protein [Flavobacterium ponti]|uniref:OmpA family protein n=1 Tax=Flavobacterium ponti TaxID=665133 RepID=A0ABV9P556_9FLAO
MNNYKVLILFLIISFTAFSQNENKGNDGDYNKWSVELNVGQNKPEKPYGEGYFSSDPNKYFNFNGIEHIDLGVRYMFNPYFGAKLDLGYDIMQNQSGTSSLPFETKQYRVGLQGIVNAGRLLKFETFTNRFGLLFHGGLQVSQLAPQKGVNKGVTEDNGGLMVGLTPQFKISKRLVLTGDFTLLSNVRQHLNWDGSFSEKANNLTGTLFNTSLGLTLYLGKKDTHADWYSEKTTSVVPVEKYDDQELKKRLEDLERKNVDIDKDGVPDYLDLQNDTVYGLKVDSKGRFIDENKNGIPDETEENHEDIKPFNTTEDPEYNAIMEFEYNIMYYDLDRVDPNKESRQKLKFVIDYLQKNPEVKILLKGYTDNLGTVQSNDILSKRRVAKLKNILESFNISGDRIDIEGKGIDTTYSFSKNGEPLARRVNIIILK